MTTIAWDGRTLAGDRRSVFGVTPMLEPIPKIYRITYQGLDSIAGYAGSLVYCQRVLAWIKAGCDQDKRPEKEKDDDEFSVVVINNNGITYFNDRFYPESLGFRPWAIGSGRDYAIGAMAAGASAKKAVGIAASYDVFTGGEIDVLTLQKRAH